MSLSARLTRNWPLKLASLGLAVLFWLVAEAEEPASKAVGVDVNLRPPAGRTLVRQPPPMTALLVGPRRELFKLTGSRVLLTRMIPDSASSRVELTVEPSDIELPRGVSVHVQDVTPRRIEVELDSVYHRTVPVHATIYGIPDSGLGLLGGLEVVPSAVRLAGPRDRLRRIDSVRTEPLYLDRLDRLDPAGDQVLRIDTAGLGPVKVRPEMVTVRLDLQPMTERTIAQVPIQVSSSLPDSLMPARESVSVVVHGDLSRLATLTADSLVVLLDGGVSQTGPAPLRLVLPAGLRGQIRPETVQVVRRSGR